MVKEDKKEEANEIQFDILKVLIDTRKKYTELYKKDNQNNKSRAS